MKKYTPFLLLAIILVASCGKTNIPDPDTSPASGTDTSQTIIETTNYILLTSREYNTNGKLVTCLTCFNPDKTMKWKRTSLGSAGTPNSSYYKGVVYFSIAYGDFTSTNQFFAYNNIYAIDINTGKDIWKVLQSPDFIYEPVIRNDSLFCSLATTNSNINYIAAYSTNTGNLLWKQSIIDAYRATKLKLDGNMLYFVSSSSNTVSNVNAFNLTTHTIKWKMPIGINLSNAYSKIEIINDMLFIKNGTGSLLAINKNTGKSVWEKEGPDYNLPVAGSNLIYSYDPDRGLLAFNYHDGSDKWHWKSNGQIFALGQPYFYDRNIFFSWTKERKYFFGSFNAVNGNNNWTTNLGSAYMSHVVVGNNIYAFKSMTTNLTTNNIMLLDVKSGVIKDSIPLEGLEFGIITAVTSSDNHVYSN